jgi:orotidine-5'-phosphate decarboxylase
MRELFQILDGKFFYDGKWNDVDDPTIIGTAKGVQPLGAELIDFHTPSGEKAGRAVVANKGVSKTLGVTVLTSLGATECVSIFGKRPIPKVLQFAQLLVDWGVDGIVCSPLELKALRRKGLLEYLETMTPGIRPKWAVPVGQTRFTTPSKAVLDGADNLVIGSPITRPPAVIGSPVDAARRIAEEVGKVRKAA